MRRRRTWTGTLLLCALGAISLPVTADVAEPRGRTVAITIDDLPISAARFSGADLEMIRRFNREMLEALRAHRVPAIGFVNESRLQVPGEVDERIAILEDWLEAGMDLGNHTYSHPDLNTRPLREYQDDVLHGEVITRRLLRDAGRDMLYFRFPFNHRGNDRDTKTAFEAFLAERGYVIAPFTVEHSDYMFNVVYADARRRGDPETMRRVRDAYVDHLDTKFDYFERLSVDLLGREIPQILLIHVNEINAACMGDMLERMAARGYAFVSLDEALKDASYHAPDDYVGRWGPSWLHRWNVSRGGAMRRDEPDPPAFIVEAYRAATRG